MSLDHHSATVGRVASLHLHPKARGASLVDVDQFEVIVGQGIVGNGRYFGRLSRSTGKPSRRQVTLIERDQIAGHASSLGLQGLSPGIVRSNIEVLGINLARWVGHELQIGDAILYFYELRTPCSKMDDICPGLRDLMAGGRQGVLAEIIRSGSIRAGDPIQVTGQ